MPNPLTPVAAVLRIVRDIDPVKVEYSNSRTASYTGLPDTPTGPFRYGFSLASGMSGPRFEEPVGQDLRQTLDLQTGVPISAFRLGVKFRLDTGLRTARIFDPQQFDVLTSTTQNHSTAITFPSLDLAINNIEKFKPLMRLLLHKLERSTLTLGYSRVVNDQYSTSQRPSGPVIENSGRSETAAANFTANLSGQWKRGVSSSLNLTQSSNATETPGPIRSEGVARSVSATVRFKIAPKGGLRLPFLGSRGTLKSGMDVSLTGSYSTDVRLRFNEPQDPERSVKESETGAMTIAARGDYSLTRNMSGGIDLGFTRTGDKISNQTVTGVRLGFNLSLLF
jgi:hypothetical protein